MLHLRLTPITRLFGTALIALSLAACAGANKKKQYAGSEDGDFVSGSSLPERQEGVSFLSGNVDRQSVSPVYFAFDSYEVEPGEAYKLDAVVRKLQGGSGQLIIAGFTDERGTWEYNRGLGERRAQAVRAHLLSLGADGSRIQTTSFGADMPADPASNEAAWAKNRRAEFGFTP